VATREDGAELQAELRDLLEAHREAGSALAARLLAERGSLEADIWVIEPEGGAAVSAAPGRTPAARSIEPTTVPVPTH
jgi:hypothetical protein